MNFDSGKLADVLTVLVYIKCFDGDGGMIKMAEVLGGIKSEFFWQGWHMIRYYDEGCDLMA